VNLLPDTGIRYPWPPPIGGESRSPRSLRPPFQRSEPSEPTGSRDRGNPKVKEQPQPQRSLQRWDQSRVALNPPSSSSTDNRGARGTEDRASEPTSVQVHLTHNSTDTPTCKGVEETGEGTELTGRVLQPRDNPQTLSVWMAPPRGAGREEPLSCRSCRGEGKPKVDRYENHTITMNDSTTLPTTIPTTHSTYKTPSTTQNANPNPFATVIPSGVP